MHLHDIDVSNSMFKVTEKSWSCASWQRATRALSEAYVPYRMAMGEGQVP